MYVVMIPSGLLGGSHSMINVLNLSPVVTVTFSGTVGMLLKGAVGCYEATAVK